MQFDIQHVVVVVDVVVLPRAALEMTVLMAVAAASFFPTGKPVFCKILSLSLSSPPHANFLRKTGETRPIYMNKNKVGIIFIKYHQYDWVGTFPLLRCKVPFWLID